MSILRFFPPAAVPLLVLPVLEAIARRSTFFSWDELEERIGALVEPGELEGLRLAPEGGLVSFSFVRPFLGTSLPVRLLLFPAALDIGKRVRLGIELRGGSVGRGRGLYGGLVSWLVRMLLQIRYGGLLGLVARLAERIPSDREGDRFWIDLTEGLNLENVRKVIATVTRNEEPDLGNLVTCNELIVLPKGLQVDLSPGPFADLVIRLVRATRIARAE